MISVMVVDDEKYARRGIVEDTEWALIGCEVVAEAANGAEALELAKQTRPQLVVSDIHMPVMDGLQMAEELLLRYPEMKVIFLTAYDEFSYAQQAIRLGAADYLLKPFEDGALEASIQRLLHLHPNASVDTRQLEDELIPLIDPTEISNRYVREAVHYIETHYQDSQINIAKMAEALGVSEGYLSRLFKAELETGINTYLTRYRIRRAMDELKDIHVKVYEVADHVGYLDIAYFSNIFKKLVGISPSDYQRRGLQQ